MRRQHLDELRRTSEDVALHKKFLYRSPLIDSLNSANAVRDDRGARPIPSPFAEQG